ncbi:hypothetical protein F0562_000026 [Nyssa sinensis]|uniref:Uncharacterized protein n=1 Tax=Nyssa sinensis TaxID=561372 RepID=A0A5J5C357_9ASTE|nr:hypothetical protein F0562_000026 [Nyssa sinensis]
MLVDNGTKLSMTCDGQETDVKGNKENNIDKILSDDVSVITSKTESEASKLPEMGGKTSDPVHADRIVESKEEQIQVEADFAQDIDVGSHGGLVEVFDTKGERNEDVHVLSVASDMPVIDRPEIMIEDFKNHSAVESSLPLTLGPGEVTRSLEDDTKDTVYEESHSKLPEMDGKSSDPVRADGIVESKEEQSERSEPKMSERDLSPEVESIEQMEAFVNTVQVEADSAQDIDVGSHGGLVEVSDTKGERNEDMHLLSVANDMPVINRPEIMIEDFKDHRAVELNLPLTLGPGEVIRSLEDDTKDTVYGESHSNLPEMDGKSSEPVRVDGIVESKEKQSEGPGSKMSECDLPPEVESVEPMEVFVSTVQVKADSAQDIDVGSHGDLVKISDTKGEGNADMNVLSVANDMPIIDRPEIMIEDFKDHKAMKSNLPLTLGPGEVIRSLEDDTKDTVYEESYSNSDSSKLCESINTSFADTDSLEEDRGTKHVIEEVPVEGEADTSEFKVTSGEKLGSSGLEARLDTIMIETQKDEANYHLKGLEPHFGNDLPQNIPPEYNTKDLSDVIPIVTSVDDNIDHSTNLSGGDNVDNHELDNIEKCDRAGNDSSEGTAEDKISENEKMPSESADSLSVLEVDQITNILEHGDTGDREIAGIDFSDIAGNESSEAAGEKKCAVETKATLESACYVTESQVVVDDGIDKVVTNLQDNDTPYLDRVLESSQVIGTSDLGNVTQTHSSTRDCQDEDNNEVLAECAGTINMVAESNHDGDVELTKSSENFNLKKPGPLPVDCQFTIKNSATVEDSHSKDGGWGVSGFSSETLQEEGENLTKQPVGVSAVDISVDSSSQTDSLEGNWGSVSVLSTQSDALAAIDAEALQQSEKSNLQKPKTASDGHHANKSDVFEHPSFMTLVESGGGVDQKDTSEIQTVQNTQQPKSDALQAGWFPSLTNVVNESQGRKKNEEIIAKVTSWSTGKQHTPLKSLLGEANLETKPKSPNPKQSPTAIRKDEAAAVNNVASATTGNSILGPKAPTNEAVKSDTGMEWNSPARYPIDNKKEKRKVKGKPYWVPFACCSSVN